MPLGKAMAKESPPACAARPQVAGSCRLEVQGQVQVQGVAAALALAAGRRHPRRTRLGVRPRM